MVFILFYFIILILLFLENRVLLFQPISKPHRGKNDKGFALNGSVGGLQPLVLTAFLSGWLLQGQKEEGG